MFKTPGDSVAPGIAIEVFRVCKMVLQTPVFIEEQNNAYFTYIPRRLH